MWVWGGSRGGGAEGADSKWELRGASCAGDRAMFEGGWDEIADCVLSRCANSRKASEKEEQDLKGFGGGGCVDTGSACWGCLH